MYKTWNKALAVVVTLTMVISLFAGIPPKAQAEESNTYEALPAPPMIMPMAVNPDYPQMEKPYVEPYLMEDGKGSLYVEWDEVEGAEKYQVILFNGSYHSYWDTPADQPYFSTAGKGMFPTAEQLEAGQVDFRRDGTGTDFAVNPQALYQKAYEKNGGLNYSTSNKYYVRVTAVMQEGAYPISYATEVDLSTEKPDVPVDQLDPVAQVQAEAFISSTEEGFEITNENEMTDLLGNENYSIIQENVTVANNLLRDISVEDYLTEVDETDNSIIVVDPYEITPFGVGVTKLKFYFWGIRVYLSKYTLTSTGGALTMLGIANAKHLLGTVAAIVGVPLQMVRHGIRFDLFYAATMNWKVKFVRNVRWQ
ncbi:MULTISPECIES: hypothetical protein [unclassified Exiguobacterium]|uniref:hypothetical protein n=1 Tax=unclassified Exiguobacterium TaxID=2644629 RepID=UPI00135A6C12|nr:MULTISPECIES: hypothetical protein [unclassified Exiguobacterium]